MIAEIDEPLLNRNWRALQADCHWLDSEDDTARSWYPAWHLVEHPGMEIEIGESATLPATRPAQTFVEIRRLLSLEKRGYSAALISARIRLREPGRDVFALYMARRDVRHRQFLPLCATRPRAGRCPLQRLTLVTALG